MYLMTPIKCSKPSDLDSEVQPFQSSEILQTQDSVTGQGTDASFIPLPLPNFAQTADILDAPLEQTFESSLRDSVSDQNLQQGGGSPETSSSGDFTSSNRANATGAAGSRSNGDGLETEIVRDTAASAPTLTANDVSGNEDSAIALDLTSGLTDTDGSESLSIVVSGVPTGASLSAGTDNGDGTWTLIQGQLSGHTLTPPSDSDADFTLTVTSTSTEATGGDTAQTVDTFDVTVNAVADAPTFTANDVSGNEDTAITLDIASALTDTDGSESLSVVVSGVPTGASLSAGTDNGDGTWTLTQGQLTGLTLTPPADSDADFTLTVTSTATDGSDTAQTVDTFDVTVNAVADAPTVTANDVSGNEDTAITLDIASALTDTDGSESLSVVVSGVPTGASLSAGTDNGDGTWTLTQGQLTGLTLTPPADSDADFTLTVTSTATDGSDTAQTVDTFDVTVNAVADAPTVTANDVSGNEDTAITLNIASALTDTHGSESLSVVVSGVQTGASLSAGTDNGDGTWTLTQGQLSGLTLTPPADSDADFTLTVTSTATDGSDTAQTVDTFDVTVNAVADAPTDTANDVSGNEDTAITLNIASALTDTDGSESLSVVVSGVPTGASLSAGTDNGDGTWTLTQAQLTGLTLTPPADSDTDFTLTATSTATDGSDTAQTVDTFNVAVSAVADAPTVTANDVSGNEDTAIALDITSALTDTDGSESLSVVVSGVPTGASLSAGTDNGDGTWTLTQGQLTGLTLTPPADSDADFTLTVTATATDGSDTAQTVDTFDVTVNAVADAPTVTANDVSGNEDTAITLDITSALTDTDGSESLSVVVSGVAHRRQPVGWYRQRRRHLDPDPGPAHRSHPDAASRFGRRLHPDGHLDRDRWLGHGTDRRYLQRRRQRRGRCAHRHRQRRLGQRRHRDRPRHHLGADRHRRLGEPVGRRLGRAHRRQPVGRHRQRRRHLDPDPGPAHRSHPDAASRFGRRLHAHRHRDRDRWLGYRSDGRYVRRHGQRRRRCAHRHRQRCHRQRRRGDRPRHLLGADRHRRLGEPVGRRLRRAHRRQPVGRYRQRRRHLDPDPGPAHRSHHHAASRFGCRFHAHRHRDRDRWLGYRSDGRYVRRHGQAPSPMRPPSPPTMSRATKTRRSPSTSPRR